MGLALLLDGSQEEKLEHIFSAFDFNHDDRIDENELAKLIGFLKGHDVQTAHGLARSIINEFDRDTGAGKDVLHGQKDMALNLEEFKAVSSTSGPSHVHANP